MYSEIFTDITITHIYKLIRIVSKAQGLHRYSPDEIMTDKHDEYSPDEIMTDKHDEYSPDEIMTDKHDGLQKRFIRCLKCVPYFNLLLNRSFDTA